MQKEIYPLPIITEQDYDAFRGLLGHHAKATYGEWCKMIAEREQEAITRQFDVRKVAVKPDDFAHYCSTHGEAANLASLWRFVAKITAGEA